MHMAGTPLALRQSPWKTLAGANSPSFCHVLGKAVGTAWATLGCLGGYTCLRVFSEPGQTTMDALLR